jgi:hypothetical protein
LKAFGGDRAAESRFENNFKATLDYYRNSRDFYVERSGLSFAKFATAAGWTEAQAQAFARTIESEGGYKRLFSEQQALADKVEGLIAQLKVGPPTARCNAIAAVSDVAFQSADNAKAQVDYVNRRIAEEAQKLGKKPSE